MSEQNNQNNQNKMDNTALVEAIKAMRENFCPETQNKVINIALRCTFLIPAVVEKNTELVADADNHVKFQDKQTAKFILINHKERGSYFPVFTDETELKKIKTDRPYRPFAMKFPDIAGLTENTPNVKGFVINPFGQNLPFTKEMLASIKQTLINVRKQREEAAKAAKEAENAEGAENAAPNITVSSSEENN